LTKLFKYELRRLLINKFFLGLLIVAALYSNYLLETVVILGVSNTAPFSGWSYGMFLAKVLPILLIALLFFISFLYSKEEKGISTLRNATSINLRALVLLRCSAMIIGFLLIAAIPIGLSLWFYANNFHFTNFGGFILPILITLLPAMLFILGLGMTAGRLHPGFLYALMLIMLLFSYLPMPYSIDLFGSNFFQSFPATLPLGADGEPAFVVPVAVWIGKTVYLISGIVLTISGLTHFRKRDY
jgi:ABC-2 type transport system permease protein